MTTKWSHVGTMLVTLALALVSAKATAAVRCDGVTPADVEKICGVKTHVVAGAGEDSGEKDLARLFSADDVPGAKAKGVNVHVLKSSAPLTQDPKWTDVKSVPGFDAAFSYRDEIEPLAPTRVVVASRGGLIVYVNLLGGEACTVDQAAQLAALALPAQNQGPSTAFEAAATGPENRDGAKLMVTAYSIIWLLVTAYLAYLWNTQRALGARIAGLEAAIDRAERREAGEPYRGAAPKVKQTADEPKKKKAEPKKKPADDDDDEDEG